MTIEPGTHLLFKDGRKFAVTHITAEITEGGPVVNIRMVDLGKRKGGVVMTTLERLAADIADGGIEVLELPPAYIPYR
jgi:hypothetical protein